MDFLKIAWEDISAIFKNRFIRVSVVAIIIVPLLYSLLYLYAFWNPYDKLSDMPVAVVNQDKGGAKDGRDVNYGKDVVDKLKNNTKIGWRFVDYNEAKSGVEGKKYYAMFVIPSDFTQNALTVEKKDMVQPKIYFTSNDKKNFLAAQINGKVVVELKAEITKSMTKEVDKVLFDNLNEIKDKMQLAADGSKKLSDGNGELAGKIPEMKDGVGKLYDGTTQLSNKVPALKDGVGQLYDGSDLLVGGLKSAQSGAAALYDGASKINGGLGDLNSKVPALKDGVGQLAGGSSQLNNGLKSVQSGVAALYYGAAQLDSGTGRLESGIPQLRGGVSQLENGLKSSQSGVAAVYGGVLKLNRGIEDIYNKIPELKGGVETLADGAHQLSNGFNAQGLDTSGNPIGLVNGLNVYASKVEQLNSSISTLNIGTTTVVDKTSNNIGGALKNAQALLEAGNVDGAKEIIKKLVNETTTNSTDVTKPTFLDVVMMVNKGTNTLSSSVNNQLLPNTKKIAEKVTFLGGKLSELDGGAKKMVDGLPKLSYGVDILYKGSSLLLSSIAKPEEVKDIVLPTKPSDITLMNGVTQLYQGSTQLIGGISALQNGASQLSSGSYRLLSAIAKPEEVQGIELPKEENKTIGSGPTLMSGVTQLYQGSTKLNGGISALNNSVPALVDGVNKLYTGSSQLMNGIAKPEEVKGIALPKENSGKTLIGGITELYAGSSKLNGGLGELNSNVPALADGVKRLNDGLGTLNGKMPELIDGTTKLKDGSKELSDKLADGSNQMNGKILNDSTTMSEFLSKPVDIHEKAINEVKTYGAGFAPYFISLSLWVGGMLMFFVIPVDIDEKIKARSSSIVLGKFLSYGIIGIVQALLASAIVLTLGLQPTNIFLYFAFNVLMSFTFIAIMQCLVFLVGDAGRLLSIVFLILQLTACAGTFPLEVVPGFFKALNPFMPFTYTVEALREVISGTDYSIVGKDAGILVAIMAVTIITSVLLKGHADKVQQAIKAKKEAAA